jgi:16S rRNA (guanine966-N2)-methyltransferase
MRVIAGELRGRCFRVPAAHVTRPTSERARAGLFDWLGARVLDARVIDLFAGSGALGIEALSRGARSAVFVERARAAVATLRRNLLELELARRSLVLALPTGRALARLVPQGPFELVLADPPYDRDFPGVAEARRLLDLLAPEGRLVIERSRRAGPLPVMPGLTVVGSRAYGETVFQQLERTE